MHSLSSATRRKTVKGVVSSVCMQSSGDSGSLEKNQLKVEDNSQSKAGKKRKRSGNIDTDVELPASKIAAES